MSDEVSGSLTQELLDGLKSGKMNFTTDGGDSIPGYDLVEEPEVELEEPAVDAEESVEAAETETEESSEDALSQELTDEDSSVEGTAIPEAADDILEVVVTSDKGRQTVKVDFSDRDKIKKYVQMAHGARKWQKERDDARTEAKKLAEEHTELKGMFSKMETAFQEDGVRGLVNLLENSDSAFESFMESELKRRNEWESLSPSQQELIRQQKELESERRKQSQLTSKYEQQLAAIQAEKQQAYEKSLESKIVPSFDRYRFSGKLGDDTAEAEFDQVLWDRAMGRLEQLPETVEITQAIIDREFRTVSQAISKHLNKQVETKVQRTIEKKKADAGRKVQATAKKGIQTTNSTEEMNRKVKGGDLGAALTDFFKLGGKF